MTKNYGPKRNKKKDPGKPKNPHHETAKLLQSQITLNYDKTRQRLFFQNCCL